MGQSPEDLTVLWTVGHSTRSIQDFLALVSSAGIRTIADVRRYPASRRSPHFDRDHLCAAAITHGLDYHHLPRLGGYRDDYLAYTATEDFAVALEELIRRATASPTAAMCAEADYRGCHRRILADVLVARGVAVNHILAAGIIEPHRLRKERPLEAFA